VSAVRTTSIAPPSRAPVTPEPARVAPDAIVVPEVAPAAVAAAAPGGTAAKAAPARKGAVRRPGGAPVYLAAVVLFAGIGAMLSARMLAGEDPALGLTVHQVAAVVPVTAPQRKVIVTRRIRIDGLTPRQIRRRGVDQIVVVHRRAPAASSRAVASAGGQDPATPGLASSGAGTGTSAAPRRSTTRTGGGSDPAPVSSDPSVTTPTPSATTPAPAAAPQATAPVQQTAPAPTPAPAPAPVATTTS